VLSAIECTELSETEMSGLDDSSVCFVFHVLDDDSVCVCFLFDFDVIVLCVHVWQTLTCVRWISTAVPGRRSASTQVRTVSQELDFFSSLSLYLQLLPSPSVGFSLNLYRYIY